LIKAIKILVEVVGWITIAGGTTLAFGGIGFVFYSKWENTTMAWGLLIVGFITGAIWATRISMKYGTMEWLSGIKRIS
jgi:tellurite resistance protein TehA-like permease